MCIARTRSEKKFSRQPKVKRLLGSRSDPMPRHVAIHRDVPELLCMLAMSFSSGLLAKRKEVGSFMDLLIAIFDSAISYTTNTKRVRMDIVQHPLLNHTSLSHAHTLSKAKQQASNTSGLESHRIVRRCRGSVV